MRMRFIVLLVIGSLFTSGIALAAPADGAAAGEAPEATTTAGWLWAVGTGTAVLDGRGTVDMVLSGDVVITDHAGDLRVIIAGASGDAEERLPAESRIVLEDFRGRIRVAGSDFTLVAEGSMAFHARGKGRVHLEGHGIYRNRAGWGTWGGAAGSDGVAYGDA